MSTRQLSPSVEVSHPSRWSILLFVLWGMLALRIGFAVSRGESLGDELALPTIALFVTSALLASRVYAMLQRRSERSTSHKPGESRT